MQEARLPLSRDRLPLSKDSQSDEPPLQTGTIRAWLLRQLRESVTMVVDQPKLLKTSMERHSFKKVDPGQRVEWALQLFKTQRRTFKPSARKPKTLLTFDGEAKLLERRLKEGKSL